MSSSNRKRRAQSDIRGSDAHSPPQRRRVQTAADARHHPRTAVNRGRARDVEEEDAPAIDEGNEDGDDGEHDQDQAKADVMVKNMVRLALAHEFSRMPIRRADMSKVLGTGSRKFKEIFDKTQKELRDVFGMEMVELPVREKTKLTQRRAAQTTAAAEKSSSNKSYIVVSTLPHEYRLPEVMGAATIKYATYQGLVAFVVALIYLNGRSIGTKALDRYLRIMQANDNHMDKILQQMQKNGYIVKVRDSAGDTGDITQYDYHLGPRAKVEIGEDGLKRLVKSVFGDECPEDIDERIQRNIGVDMSNMTIADEAGGEGEDADDEIGATARKKAPASNTRRKQTRSRRTQDDDDDDY